MYEEHIPVDVISEIFENIDIKEKDYREKALKIMGIKKCDVYGIIENDIIKKVLNINGKEKIIEDDEVLSNDTPLIDVLYKIHEKKKMFHIREWSNKKNCHPIRFAKTPCSC